MQSVLIFLLIALLEIETKSIIALGKTNEIAEQIPTVIGQSPEYNNDDKMLTNIGQKHAGNTQTKGMFLFNFSSLRVYTQLTTSVMTLILLYSLKLY